MDRAVTAPELIDPGRFAAIMGSFPSGVAVVTACDAGGTPRGLTTSSCCSGSLDPPLVLVSVSKSSNTLPAIVESGTFAVNYLATRSAAVGDAFATKAEDKYAELSFEVSALGNPILREHVCAHAECRLETMVETGDHQLVVGAVVHGEVHPRETPLVYHRRDYFRLGEAVT